MIKFESTREEDETIDRIARRALKLDRRRDLIDWKMDLIAVHSNGCPMDFKNLEAADDFNFSHDMLGIMVHLDREDSSKTGGQLLHCFRPRAARRSL